VQRVLKFVRYLPQFGWEPVVLTVSEKADFPARDESLCAEIPKGSRVFRTRIFEPYKLYRALTGKAEGEAVDIATNTRGRRKGVGEAVSEWVRSTFFIPDARRFWKGPAVRAGMKIIRNEKIDLIFSSAPPYTCHLIAGALKRKSGLPWIADFRDSWVGWLSAPKRWSLPRRIDLRLEGSALSLADRLLAVSDGVRDDMVSRHADASSGKWATLPNGFDGTDFRDMVARPHSGKFVLTYTGSLYGKRNPLVLLEAVRSLVSEKPELRNKLLFRFVGRADASYLTAFRDFGGMIETVPYVSHRESLQYLMDSSALLLIIDDAPASRSIATGKLYEYVGARKPILALAPEGAAAELIRSLEAGVVVRPDDVEEIQKALARFVEQWERKSLSVGSSAEKVGRYERRRLTGELAALFDGMVS
jgi:glycosyltransferase involved in cell wall biosynthesis